MNIIPAKCLVLMTMFTLSLSGCMWISDDDVSSKSIKLQDADSDGYKSTMYGGEDCDDTDRTVNPNAEETWYDGVDQNCDGLSDYDIDGDGDDSDNHGGNDCDDYDIEIFFGAAETCDSTDNNCNGEIDEDVQTEYFADEDDDGYGSNVDNTKACELPDGYTYSDGDCDDTNSDVNPVADEVCDGVDNDCDDEVDEGVTSTYYRDLDGDLFGLADVATEACETPDEYTEVSGDCDDDDSGTHPEASEVCDGVDNNCDDSIDGSDAVDETTWYMDSDEDGYGDPMVAPIIQCFAPTGYVADFTDCADDDVETNPGAMEIIGDDYDGDCDGDDDGFGWYDLDLKGATGVIGPKLHQTSASGMTFMHLGWGAEECSDPTSVESRKFDCTNVSRFDADDFGAEDWVEPVLFEIGEADDIGDVGEVFDFVASNDSWGWGRSILDDEGRTHRVDAFDQTSLTGNFKIDLFRGTVSQAPTIQVSIDEETMHTQFCGATGGPTIDSHMVDLAALASSSTAYHVNDYIMAEDNYHFYNYSSSGTGFYWPDNDHEAYSEIGQYEDSGDIEACYYDTNANKITVVRPDSQRIQHFTWHDSMADTLISSYMSAESSMNTWDTITVATDHYVAVKAWLRPGTYADMYLSTNDASTHHVGYEYGTFTVETIRSDIAVSPSSTGYLCSITNDNRLVLHYDNPASYGDETPWLDSDGYFAAHYITMLNLAPFGEDAYVEDCSVTVDPDNVLLIAARSGDQIKYGLVNVP